MKKTLAILLAALMLIGMFSFASAEINIRKLITAIEHTITEFSYIARNVN